MSSWRAIHRRRAPVSSLHDIFCAAPRPRTIMPTTPKSAMNPNMPTPPAAERIPEAYIATISPSTPNTSATGNTIDHTLRGGGTG